MEQYDQGVRLATRQRLLTWPVERGDHAPLEQITRTAEHATLAPLDQAFSTELGKSSNSETLCICTITTITWPLVQPQCGFGKRPSNHCTYNGVHRVSGPSGIPAS